MIQSLVKNKKDINRFGSAWKYIDDKITDEESNEYLKVEFIQKCYIQAKDITEKDTEVLTDAINKTDDEILKEGLLVQLYAKQNTDKEIKAHINKIKAIVGNKNEELKFIAAWSYVDNAIQDENAEVKLRKSVIDL